MTRWKANRSRARQYVAAITMLTLALLCLVACGGSSQEPGESKDADGGIWLQAQPGDNGNIKIAGGLTNEATFQGVSFKYADGWKVTGDDNADPADFSGVASISCGDSVNITIQPFTQGETSSLEQYLSLGMDIPSDIEELDRSDRDGLISWNAYYEISSDEAPRTYLSACDEKESGHGYMIVINVYRPAQNESNYDILRDFVDSISYDPLETSFDCATDDLTEYQRSLIYGNLVNTPPEESSFVQGYLANFGTFDPIVLEGNDWETCALPPGDAPFIITSDSVEEVNWDLRLQSRSAGWFLAAGYSDMRGPETFSVWEKTGNARKDAFGLVVQAKGSWRFTMKPLKDIQPLVPGQVYEGDQVFYIDTTELKSLEIMRPDSVSSLDSFRVRIAVPEGNTKEFRQDGPFHVYVDVDAPQCVLSVDASGPWSIAWDTASHSGTSQSNAGFSQYSMDDSFANTYIDSMASDN